jgi:hypothetical protein
MSPQASKNRRWLCRSTYSRVAISTSSAVRRAAQNPQIWTISASRWIQPTSAQIGGYGRAVLKGSRAVGNRERRPVCMFMRWPPERERPVGRGVDGLGLRARQPGALVGMMHFSEPIPIFSTCGGSAHRARLAAAAYLGRFKGSSREHTESDLRCYLTWCAGRGLDPLAARRPDLELYIRWMQELRRFSHPRWRGGSRWPLGSTGPA